MTAPKLDKRKVKKMKPAQLKEELKLRGLSIQGNARSPWRGDGGGLGLRAATAWGEAGVMG